MTSVQPKKKLSLRSKAIFLSIAIALVCLCALASILLPRRGSRGLVASVYQDGALLQTIDLACVDEPYSFSVPCKTGGENVISVFPNAIGITDADCPDRLCVSMGIVKSSLLPIVCLPHGLVIEITEKSDTGTGADTPDAITY